MKRINAELVRAEGGTLEKRVPIEEVVVPDLWHIAHEQDPHSRDQILEAWYLAHDLLKHARKQAGLRKD